MKRFGLMAFMTAGALALSGGAAMGGGSARPFDISLTNGNQTVEGSQGSYCYSNEGDGLCGDYAYPLEVEGRLPARRGKTITLQMNDDTIKTLSARLLRVKHGRIKGVGRVEVVQSEENPEEWIATIPDAAPKANRISIFVRYKQGAGDSNWWAGVKLRGEVPE